MAQLIHQDGVSTLINEGWLENPSVSSITARRYLRYNSLIVHWAREINVAPELVEMRLVHRGRQRCDEIETESIL